MQEKTPLQLLIDKYRYHMDFADLNLSDINQQCFPDDDALIHLVTRVGSLEEINILIASKAQVNASGDLGFTPLHYAAMRGRFEVIKRLLELGADPNIRNEFGETPADVAQNAGFVEIAFFLNQISNKE